MRTPWNISFIVLLALGTSATAVYGQGRGVPPQAPPSVPAGPPPQAGGNVPTPPRGPAGPRGPENVPANGGPVVQPASAGAVDQLARVPRLASRLEGMLVIPEGSTVDSMAEGFPNLGQFVAAVQVSNNVEGVSFDLLKLQMLDGEGMSLGEAIQEQTGMAPEDANVLAGEAEQEAEELIEANP